MPDTKIQWHPGFVAAIDLELKGTLIGKLMEDRSKATKWLLYVCWNPVKFFALTGFQLFSLARFSFFVSGCYGMPIFLRFPPEKSTAALAGENVLKKLSFLNCIWPIFLPDFPAKVVPTFNIAYFT